MADDSLPRDAHAYPPNVARWVMTTLVISLLAAAVAGSFAHLPAMAFVAFLATQLLLTFACFVPATVTFGEDGFSYSKLGNTWFVEYGAITRIDHTASATTVRLADGRKIRLVNRHQLGLGEFDRDAIDRALAAFRARGAAPPNLLPAPEGSASEWLASLRALGQQQPEYRAEVPQRDDLLRMLEHPATHEASRMGAAIALRADLAADERARIRVAAGTTASPRLRVALETIAAESATDDDVARVVSRSRVA